jgi:hypothetical protein
VFDHFRNFLLSAGADLKSRRLLIAIAIPLLMSHAGTATSLAALPPAPTVTALTPAATTRTVTPRHAPKRSDVAGPAHDPFATTTTASSPTTTASSPATAATGAAGRVSSTVSPAPATGEGAAGEAGTASPSQSTVTVTTPGPTVIRVRTVTRIKTVVPPPPFKAYEPRLSLRENSVAAKAQIYTALVRFELLPGGGGAFASYLGIRRDKRTAVFLLAEGVRVTAGDGDCTPTPWKCSILTLQPGQGVRLEVPAGVRSHVFTLRYAGVDVITSSASLVYTDRGGRAAVAAAQARVPQLKKMQYARYTGLLSIALGSTAPVAY